MELADTSPVEIGSFVEKSFLALSLEKLNFQGSFKR